MQSSDIRRAVYLTVHEFPARPGLSSVESAAQLLGRAVGTVYNKADPGNDQQTFNLEEAAALINAAGDFRVLHAFARACDHVVIAVGDHTRTSDTELLDLLLLEIRSSGARAERIRHALTDGDITHEELRDIRRATDEHITAQLELLARLEGLHHAAFH